MKNHDINIVNGMSPTEKEPCTTLKEGEKPKEAPGVRHKFSKRVFSFHCFILNRERLMLLS